MVLANFLKNLGGSLGFGLGYSILACVILKYCRFISLSHHSAVLETAIVFFFGYMAYVSAEILELSGVISVLVCGILMAHYLFYNLSNTGKVTTG